MAMQIDREVVPESTIEQFAERHGLTMKLVEREMDEWQRSRKLERYCAYFRSAEVKGNGVLIGVHGNGDTEAEAIADYAAQISLKTLVLDAFGSERVEIKVPRLVPGAF